MKHIKKLLCAGLLMTLGFSVKAAIIYDNGVIGVHRQNGSSFTMGNMQEIGNEITIGPNWSLTNFAIEYYTPDSTLAANVGIDVRFYLNSGTPTNGFATPALTPFYDSGWFFGLLGGGYQVVDYAS